MHSAMGFYSAMTSMIRSKYGKDGITEMDRIGGVAEVLDDTQMSIYTAQGIIQAAEKNCDYEGMVKEIYPSYLLWYCGHDHCLHSSGTRC